MLGIRRIFFFWLWQGYVLVDRFLMEMSGEMSGGWGGLVLSKDEIINGRSLGHLPTQNGLRTVCERTSGRMPSTYLLDSGLFFFHG